MKNYKKLPLLFLLIAVKTFNLFAGEKQEKWGQIDPKIFDNRSYPDDTSAAAVVLFDKCDISISVVIGYLYVVYEEHKRIQILRKDGFGQATVVLPYFSYHNVEQIDQLDAQTLNLDSHGTVVKTAVPKNAIYDENTSDYLSAKKFVFSDVKEGSVIEYDYIVKSKNFGYLRTWPFQSEIPTVYSELVSNIPYYLRYSTMIEGKYRVEQKSEPYGSDAGNLKTTYTLKNVPAIKQEAFTTNLKDYMTSARFALTGITIPYTKSRFYNENWEELAKNLRESDNFGLRLDKGGDYINLAKSVTADVTDTREKVKRIYKAVTDHIKWNEIHSVYPGGKLKDAFDKGKGNSADINMLLLDMLRTVGIKADPVLVSTRDHGRTEIHFPDESQFNHVIVSATIDTEQIFLDATNPLRPYDLVAFNDLNTLGFRLTQPFISWKPVMAARSSSGDITSTIFLDSTGNISGKGNITLTDYRALDVRAGVTKTSLKEFVNKAFHKNAGINIINPVAENLDDPDKNVKINFGFKKDEINKDDKSGIVYLNPFPVTFIGENPFKLKERDYPVDFGYPFEETFRATVFLPANYKVTEAPKTVNYVLPDGSAKLMLVTQVLDNMIQVRSTFKINKSVFKPDEYERLKEIFALMIDALNSTFVLEKK